MNGRGEMQFPVGKLPLSVLDRMLKRNVIQDGRIIVGPAVGEDAAVIDIGGTRYLIAKTDPITFTADHIGWYAVHVNANDIAAMGGRPQWFLVTLLLPEERTTEGDVEKIFQDILDACQSLGISLIGGHTEITYGLDRPIVVGQMLGEVEKERLVRTDGTREGDAIILTKGLAVEGTAIIAREREKELAAILDKETLARCKNFMRQPGISVLKEALIAGESAKIHAMHDPTEGGLATALHELARAAEVGIIVQLEAIRVFPETKKLCEYYHLDPMGLIASGALLIVVEASEEEKVMKGLQSHGIPASRIGQVVHQSKGIKIRTPSGLHDLPIFEQDELTKIT